MGADNPDFSGYATKAGLKCSDGRVITSEAFAHMDGKKVPLVWQHTHNDPGKVLGYAILEARPDGVYAKGYFNESASATNAKIAVQHGDVVSMSIYANALKEAGNKVLHGFIREVSLVLAGANPGAMIDNVRLAHGDDPDDFIELEDTAIIHSGEVFDFLSHDDDEDEENGEEEDNENEENDMEHADDEYDVQEVLESLDEDQSMVVHSLLENALAVGSGAVSQEDVAEIMHADETMKDVYNSLNPMQKKVVHYMLGMALEQAKGGDAAAQHNDADDNTVTGDDTTDEGNLEHQEGTTMTRNLFEGQDGVVSGGKLTHDAFAASMTEAEENNSTYKKAMLKHAAEYGIDNIEMLFPDAKALGEPEMKARRTEWVAKVLDGTKHTPFAKVKSIVFDITEEEARAKGYIKGNQKKDEVIQLLRRTTGPTTVYKKQRLDRDDVLDITDMDVVAFLKAEIRLMLEEEVARAILVGDGRSALSEDKIKDPAGSIDGTGIRSILKDHELYAIRHELDANVAPKEAVKGMVRARAKWRGTGKPTLFVSDNWLTEIMLEEDKFGRPLYETQQSLADKLRVTEIVVVDVFDEEAYGDLFAIMVNLRDYSVGTNKGGEITTFEDFDIDFNQHKYLQETRLSGGLTKPYSAVVVTRAEGTLATATAPSFDGGTNTITIPTSEGVVYSVNDEAKADGAEVVITETSEVTAAAKEGYYLAPNTTRTWTYTPS